MSKKRAKRIAKADLPISSIVRLLVEDQQEDCMNSLLEQISPDNIAELWKLLRDSARDAKLHTTLELWGNGTTSKGGSLGAVTVSTIPGGFALIFTERGIFT